MDHKQYLSEEFNKKVGRNLKACRKAWRPKVTQAQMAIELGYERQHIMRVENGVVPATAGEVWAYGRRFHIAPSLLIESSAEEITKIIKSKNVPHDIFGVPSD